MTQWALLLQYYSVYILLGSSTVTSSSLKHYIQFLRPQGHNKRNIGPTHTSSRFNVHLQNISIDQEHLCRETCTKHVCNAVELLQTSLCTMKDRVQNDFQRTDATSKYVLSELPTNFDSTIFQKIVDVLNRAFEVIYVLEHPFWNESASPVFDKKTSISFDTSIFEPQPIKVRLLPCVYFLIDFICALLIFLTVFKGHLGRPNQR